MLNSLSRGSRLVRRSNIIPPRSVLPKRAFSLARTSVAVTNRSLLSGTTSFSSFTQFELRGATAIRSYASSSDDYPPHIPLGMPALSPTMTQGNLVKWLKKPGDEVSVGDALADIETDKAVMKWDSIDDGFFVKAYVEEGTEAVPVGKVIALLVEDKDDIDAFSDYKPPEAVDEDGNHKEEAPKKEESKKEEKKEKSKEDSKEEPEKQESKKSESKKEAPKKSSGGRVIASPAARGLAAEKGIDLSEIQGSGPNGRIVVADVENFKGESKGSASSSSTSSSASSTSSSSSKSSSSTSGGSYEDIPNSNIRKVIASRLTESKQTIPHYYLTVEFCVDKLQKVRGELNGRANGAYKLSINDFVVKASAMAMRKVPEVNSSWSEKHIRRYNDVNINVAVNSDVGLFTPLLPNTDNKGLIEIASSVRTLAEKAKAGKLTPDELQIGTFTISNLGMFGIKQFAAVINPPQACILAVGGIEERVVSDGEGFKTSSFMTCTLSCDHRVVDGALGATWLKEFKSRMEDPITMLL